MQDVDPAGDDEGGGDEPAGYTLDELAERSGVPARTVRYYRDAGLLAAPRRIGRRAYYAPDQLDRLLRLARLRAEGVGLEAAGRVLDDPAGARRTLDELLDVGQVLRGRWVDDEAADLRRDQVCEVMGTDEAWIVDLLEHHGVVVRTASDPDRFHVPSVATLELAGDLAAAGLGPDFAEAAWPMMERAMADLADALLQLYLRTEGPPESWAADAVERRFERIQPVAMRALQVVFGHQMEQVLARYADAAERYRPDR